jgi:hypothetical protein
MSGFNWDDNDPLEGFDTDPTPSPPPPRPAPKLPTAQPRPAAPQSLVIEKPTPSGRGAPLKVNPEALAQAMEDFDEESAGVDADQLSEAEWRLEKAQYYRDIINSQLLSSGHPAAVEVEQELQGWAKNQMEVLLGIKASNLSQSQGNFDISGLEERLSKVEAVPARNNLFTEDEAAALRAVAARVLSKQGTNAPLPTPKPTEPVIAPAQPSVKPVSSKPQAVITPVKSVSKPRPAGRGRPRKNPCAICGQMECGHKSNQTKIPTGSQVVKTPLSDTFQGIEVKIVDGKRVVDMPNGVRYRLDRRPVQYKDGTIKEEDIPTELSRPIASPRAAPYPSEQEAMAIAAVEGAASERKIQSNPLLQKIVAAAQTGPERESYVPQRPQK